MPFTRIEAVGTRSPSGDDELDIHRALFAAYPDALIIADGAGRIVLANPRAADLLGYTTSELVGLDVDALVPDSVRGQHGQYRRAYARAPRARPMGTQMDLVAKRRDGSEVMVEIALSPLDNLGVPYVVAAIRDIGAYPRVRQALRRARYSEHLALFGKLAVDAREIETAVHDVPSIIAGALEVPVAVVYLLEGGSRNFRIAGQRGLVDFTVGQTVPNRGDSLPGFVAAAAGAVVVGDLETDERLVLPDSHRSIGLRSALFVPLLERGRTVGVLEAGAMEAGRFGADEIRFLEALANLLSTSLQRAQSEEALSHSQRLETVGQLTGGIAHDFNNLLTIIAGNLQVLEEMPAVHDDPLAPQLVTAAARAARRGAELTGKLLAFSRRQRLQPSAVDVGPMLGSLTEMLKRTLDTRVRIDLNVEEACPATLVDPGQLESALLNIAINARDAMPDGGILHFSARRCDRLPEEIRGEVDGGESPNGYVAIAVTDSGTGMPDHIKERAFEPFFTTKEVGRGTGLGLSTVYGFVKQSRGAVVLESAPGAGTTIALYLPASLRQGEAADRRPAASHEAVMSGMRILLCEDEAEVRNVALRFLEGLGCEVTATSSGEEALALVESGASPDLLLSDVALGPGMRGTRLASLVELLRPGIAVLLLSGYSSELLEADHDSPGRWELLQKPYSRDELVTAIRRAMRAPS